MSSLEIAKLYFELSNKSDFEGIEELLTESTTYSSKNTGIYLGAEDIMKMQREFHGSFKSLGWTITSSSESKSGVVLFDYAFVGTKNSGEEVEGSGVETIVIHNDKIQHIEIR